MKDEDENGWRWKLYHAGRMYKKVNNLTNSNSHKKDDLCEEKDNVIT
jgi:hypothetical protein